MGHRPPQLVPDGTHALLADSKGLAAELDSPLPVGRNRTVCHGGCCASWTRACAATFADVLAHVREIQDTCGQRSGARTDDCLGTVCFSNPNG